MKARTSEAVNIQLLEVIDDPYTVTDTYEASFHQRVTFKMLDKEKRRRMTTCAIYVAILLLGILIGLIPYILSYVKESNVRHAALHDCLNIHQRHCNTSLADAIMQLSMRQKDTSAAVDAARLKADREVLRDFINKNITNSLMQILKLQDKLRKFSEEQQPAALAITAKATKTILHKKASVIGNGSITLVCKGKITVAVVKLNDVNAYPSDVAKFNRFCQSRQTKDKDTISCDVSMSLILGFTLGSTEYTEVEYTCEDTCKEE